MTDCGDTTAGGVPGQLRWPIGSAAPGDTIVLPPCTVTLTGDETGDSGDLDIAKHLTIRGAGSGLTTIDAGGTGSRVFHVFNGVTVTIADLCVRNGRAPANLGGGIYNASGSLTLSNVPTDVRKELIDLASAREDYGVVPDAATWTVDAAATVALRAELRARRGWREVPIVSR